MKDFFLCKPLDLSKWQFDSIHFVLSSTLLNLVKETFGLFLHGGKGTLNRQNRNMVPCTCLKHSLTPSNSEMDLILLTIGMAPLTCQFTVKN